MKNIIFSIVFVNLILAACFAQSNQSSEEINNLLLPKNYLTSEYNSIPQYSKTGKGKQALVLIPGLGFDKSVFDDFIKANRKYYTIYCITIPGYGNTKAPPLPPAGTSFGEQAWNKSAESGICKLIQKEKMVKPVIVGHFVQGSQLALRMAIDHPDIVGRVIIVGGAAKFILINNGNPIEYPLKSTISYIDKNTAPNWFKTISKNAFDEGNYLPEIYSLDSNKASSLWNQMASVPLPVIVHAICEFFASDITLEMDKIKCPVLIIRPLFNKEVLQKQINNYVKPQFIDSWGKASGKNALITIKDIQGAATFAWKDKPDEVYAAIKTFLNQ